MFETDWLENKKAFLTKLQSPLEFLLVMHHGSEHEVFKLRKAMKNQKFRENTTRVWYKISNIVFKLKPFHDTP